MTINLGKFNMSLYEFARWCSLIEAVELIGAKCDERNINLDSPEGIKYIKPLDILQYVDDRTNSMYNTIDRAKKYEDANHIKNIVRDIRKYTETGLPI